MGRGARFGEGAVGLDSEVWCVGEKRKEEKWRMAWRPGETMVGHIFSVVKIGVWVSLQASLHSANYALRGVIYPTPGWRLNFI